MREDPNLSPKLHVVHRNGYFVPVRRPGTTVLAVTTPEPAPRDRRCLMLAMAIAAAFLAGMIVGTAAPAMGETLVTDDDRRTVESADGSDILLWHDPLSLVDGLAMIENGAVFRHPLIVEAKLACAVPSGTEVGGTNRDWHGTTEVTVLDGAAAGCSGVVLSEQVRGGSQLSM